MNTKKRRPAVVLGAPGSGKQTLIDQFLMRYDCGHISPGQAGREEQEQNTHLGRQIRVYQDAGIMIPLPLTFQLIQPRFTMVLEKEVFFLDGFPRTMEQIPLCFQLVDQYDCEPLNVLYINTPDEICLERLMKAKRGRKDDGDADTARIRLEVYHKETLPVIEAFERGDCQHKVHFAEIDGSDMQTHAEKYSQEFADIWGLTPRV